MITTIIKRNGKSAPFEQERIRKAIYGAFWEFFNKQAQTKGIKEIPKGTQLDPLIEKKIDDITADVVAETNSKNLTKVEEIENLVEDAIWQAGYKEISKLYIGYRQLHEKKREETQKKYKISITKSTGEKIPFKIEPLEEAIKAACKGIKDVSEKALLAEAENALYDGVKTSEITEAMIQAARSFIEREPAYSFVAGRLLLQKLADETLHELGFDYKSAQIPIPYEGYFQAAIKQGVSEELYDPRLENDFDLEKLANALVPDRDLELQYLGLKTLGDRYFVKSRETRNRIELPQTFFMRVAMGLAIEEKEKTEKAIEFYHVLSQRLSMSSTPTLFNAGTKHSQLASCFLYKIDDNIESILINGIANNGFLSKWAGGLGGSWTGVRGSGGYIHGTNGESNGIIPFLKIHNDQLVAVNQGGKRRGSGCAYLETWHIDIEEFIDLRKETGDERRRCHDMNTANWIPDLFMKRVHENGTWWLFSPDKTPELHELYGQAFEKKYKEYEKIAEEGKGTEYADELGLIKKSSQSNPLHPCKRVSAVALWKKMLASLFETGHPWITFKDSANIRNPQDHVGVIHSSNLCTEIFLNTSSSNICAETGEVKTRGETAVCNLNSINLVNHIREGKIDQDLLKSTVRTAMRMLDNVIDINFYPIPEAKLANTKHRPVGLGIMGFHTALQMLNIPFDSQDAIDFADVTQELIALYAIEASCDLAEERGKYSSYEGSKWDKGIFPLDSLNLLKEERGEFFNADTSCQYPEEWERLKTKVKKHGMRNSNTMAIAPTATIGLICGVSEGNQPEKSPVYRKENLSGSFPIVNQILINTLKKLKLWEGKTLEKIKLSEGSIQHIEEIPKEIRNVFKTQLEIHPSYIIEGASRRQKWIDQGQSLNLFANQPNGQFLSSMYKLAWVKGLKSTYYLRSVSSSQKEKTSIEVQKVGSTLKSGKQHSLPTPTLLPTQTEEEPCESCQ